MAINLCGESGLVNQIKDKQAKINEFIALGKNAIFAVTQQVNDIKNLIDAVKDDPDVVERSLQEDLLNILSRASLSNPTGALAQLLQLRRIYQNAGPGIDRIIDNVELFLKDPLNTPLDICKDIPNIIQVKGEFVAKPSPAKVPDPSAIPTDIKDDVTLDHKTALSIKATSSEELLNDFSEQDIEMSCRFASPDVANDINIAGRYTVQSSCIIPPGAANQAAYATPAPFDSSFMYASVANPFPEGKQYTESQFSLSRFSRAIASKINTLNPVFRESFVNAITEFINLYNDIIDININEAYRQSDRFPKLSGSLSVRKIQALDFFIANGYTPEQSAGIVGNLIGESNLVPTVVAKNDAGPGLDSKGLAQWNRSRLANLEKYAIRNGRSPDDFVTQLEFIIVELNGEEAGARRRLEKARTVEDATLAFTFFERFKGYEAGFGSPETRKRINYARGALVEYNQTGSNGLNNLYANATGGNSWHNYGLAIDIDLYTPEGVLLPPADSTVYNTELKNTLARYGIVNNHGANPQHFYIASVGDTVPEKLLNGELTLSQYFSDKGIA